MHHRASARVDRQPLHRLGRRRGPDRLGEVLPRLRRRSRPLGRVLRHRGHLVEPGRRPAHRSGDGVRLRRARHERAHRRTSRLAGISARTTPPGTGERSGSTSATRAISPERSAQPSRGRAWFHQHRRSRCRDRQDSSSATSTTRHPATPAARRRVGGDRSPGPASSALRAPRPPSPSATRPVTTSSAAVLRSAP